MRPDTEARANAAFKKQQRAVDASAAWNEYEANRAHVDSNMMRLRALRLAREAAAPVIKEQRKRKKAV